VKASIRRLQTRCRYSVRARWSFNRFKRRHRLLVIVRLHLPFRLLSNARPNAPSLELENEPCLVAEIVLIVIPGGEVVNETRQKIIGFDRPDRQVRSDFNIDATPKHYIQGPIAR